MSTSTIVLPPVSASVPEARRFVADCLADLPSETVDVARLLVSEVVTNAVLHAQTELSLTLDRGDKSINVKVADANPLLPVLRTHGTDAGTGRGLKVLDKMASRWGTDRTHEGKVVWFEISTTGPSDETGPTDRANQTGSVAQIDHDRPVEELQDPRRARTGGAESDPDGNLFHFEWRGLPLAQLESTSQHYDSVLREFHLILTREPMARAAVPGRLIALMDELTQFGQLISSVEQDLQRGRRSGASSVDVSFDLPQEIGPLALRLDGLLDEADAYCAAGDELLSLEPDRAIVALRKWLIGEIARQADGHQPVAWQESPWARSIPRQRRDEDTARTDPGRTDPGRTDPAGTYGDAAAD
jgi:Histidine kinase-like ATPase domain